jgi:ubiquinone/menaquinone biosynthesis C-methylase UbiE
MAVVEHDKREVQKQWDQNPCAAETVRGVPLWSRAYYREIRRHRYHDYAPWMAEALGLNQISDCDVLEIGVGLGSDHVRLALAGNRMTALDLSAEHLRRTRQHLAHEGLASVSHLGDAEQMPYRDASFDLVYSFGVLHHTPNTQRAIDEVHRVLRPGGTALITLYHRNSWFYWLSTILIGGILKAGLIRKGLRGMLSEIEYRSDSASACPLVKVYSRRDAGRMFGAFAAVEMTTHHVEASHFHRLGGLLRRVDRTVLERRLARGGWYLVVRATK